MAVTFFVIEPNGTIADQPNAPTHRAVMLALDHDTRAFVPIGREWNLRAHVARQPPYDGHTPGKYNQLGSLMLVWLGRHEQVPMYGPLLLVGPGCETHRTTLLDTLWQLRMIIDDHQTTDLTFEWFARPILQRLNSKAYRAIGYASAH